MRVVTGRWFMVCDQAMSHRRKGVGLMFATVNGVTSSGEESWRTVHGLWLNTPWLSGWVLFRRWHPW